MPTHHASSVVQSAVAQELACSNRTELPEATTRTIENGAFVMTMTQTPSIWDKRLEREFRKLALDEAKGPIADADARRLNQLNLWRDQLLCPLTVDEILLQMKRDRLLTRMENLLKEYVEFQESANQTRFAA